MKLRYTPLYCVLLLISTLGRAQAPIEFIENRGQWGDWFHFKAETRGGDVFLEDDGLRFVLADRSNNIRLDSFHHGQRKDNPVLRFHCYKVTLEGAQKPAIQGLKPQKTYNNYYLGNDPKRWKTGIHPNLAVDYTHIYKGIDLHFSSEKGNVVYEFMVQPQANANQIRLSFEGQEKMYLRNGDLYVQTSVGDVKEMKPYVYQYINDVRTEVVCNYKLDQNKLSFEFPNDYDHSKLLVIDPTVVFSTLTGSTADNWGFTATYDNAGNFYAGGLVNCLTGAGGGGFPVSPGAFQTTWGGGYGLGGPSEGYAYGADISIFKYNPSGTTRLYATYIGGAQNEHPHSMIVDGNNNLIIAGRTMSTNYPVSSSAYQSSNRGRWDMVVTNLNSTGTALIGSTYIGGTGDDCVNYDSTEYFYGELKHNYGDDSRSEVLVDNADNIYVTGCTWSTNFPTTSTAISSTLSGLQDGIAFKMNNNCSSLIWSTYITGNASDAGYVLAFDSLQQYVYVAGGTNSSNLPTTSGAWKTSYQGGGADGFVMKFLNSGSYALQKCTYVGTTGYDQVYGIQIYPTNDVYLMGQAIGGTFPVTSGVYSNPNSTQFVMKMDPNLTTDLISTVFGSGASSYTNIAPAAFMVDTCSNVYISGWGGTLGITGSSTGTCTGMYVTGDAVQPATDGSDFYFIVFGANLTSVRYATFYGRNCSSLIHGEHVDGGTSRFDKHGIIYQAICANCGGTDVSMGACPNPFPTTSGVWSMVDSSRNCNEAALKIAFNLAPVEVDIIAGPSTNGCAPLTVNFTNLTQNGANFLWDYGDGSPTDTTFSPTHTFTAAGTFTVTLTAHNANACFVTDDTMTLVVTVAINQLNPDFTFVVTDSCGPYAATFTNTSTGTSAGTNYQWYFSDGTTFAGANPGAHTFPDSGSYTVTLVLTDTSACNSPDSITKTISIYGFRVGATFVIPDSLCLGLSFTPITDIKNATSTVWTYSDGFTSTSAAPAHTFTAVGTYSVTLVVTNPGSCNGADTFIQVIKIITAPIANFTFVPITAEPNIPTTFTNLSVNAVRYNWDFGDGTNSNIVNPVHQFSRTGTYHVCLTAYNSSNCPSVACREVPADVTPIIGLPTGFSPNGDGENDILYVRGAAIQTLDLKIYNRWGQMVFQTTDKAKGWDGTFNGQPCPVEAYGYVLTVSFIDASSKTLKGNITLLR